jgi:hypothetical protein
MSAPSPKAGGPNLFTALFGLAFLAAAGVIGYLQWENIKQTRQGPTEVQASALAKAESLDGLPGWVKFKPTKVTDTGVRRERTVNGRPVGTFKYLLVQVGDRYVVAEAWDTAATTGAVTGRLEQWPARDRDGVVAEIYGKVAAARDKMTPFQIDTHTTNDEAALWMWVLGGICGFFGIGLVWTGVFGFKVEPPPSPPEAVEDDPVRRWAAARGPSRDRY